MTPAALGAGLGAGMGAGLWLIARGIWPPRPSLPDALAALRRTPAPAPVLGEAESGALLARLGRPIARGVGDERGAGLISAAMRRDLHVLGRSPEHHLAEKLGVAVFGLLLAPAVAAALYATAGVQLPVVIPLWGSLLMAAAGFFVPDLSIRSRVAERRRDFRHALSAFLDLVVIAIAGGTGVEGALRKAAAVGDGWAFASLRGALEAARLSRETPWASLGRLGAELGVGELEEMAASVSLAGTEGARVRQSLAAKAESLRMHRRADAESEGQAATERMSLPVAVMVLGFMLFIGFAAVTRVVYAL